jgi:hypothetical protein
VRFYNVCIGKMPFRKLRDWVSSSALMHDMRAFRLAWIIQMQRNVISADEVRTNGTAFFEALEISSVCFPDFEQNTFASAMMSVLTTIPGTAKPPALCFVIMYALFPI